MNFLIFRDFFGFFLNFYEFKIDLFNLKSILLICAGDMAKSGAFNQITIVDPGMGDVATRGASDRAIKSKSTIVT